MNKYYAVARVGSLPDFQFIIEADSDVEAAQLADKASTDIVIGEGYGKRVLSDREQFVFSVQDTSVSNVWLIQEDTP